MGQVPVGEGGTPPKKNHHSHFYVQYSRDVRKTKYSLGMTEWAFKYIQEEGMPVVMVCTECTDAWAQECTQVLEQV